jgi:Mg2+-importing ATPase
MTTTQRSGDDGLTGALADALSGLGVTAQGLSQTEANRRLRRYGPNLLEERTRYAALRTFISRFKNPLVLILIAAGAVSAMVHQQASFVMICVMVLASVTLDFVQEYRANRAAQRLRESIANTAQVLRDGACIELPVRQLVPGDVVRLAAGDRVPADGRLLEGRDFFVNQSLLTGEPYPVEKFPDQEPLSLDPDTNRAAVFMGASVISGSATVLVCRTGKASFLGGIASSLQQKAPPTAFERGTRQFGLLIMRLTLLLVLFVLFTNTFFGRPWLDMFLFAVALAVGLTPELLPMIVSVTLARGAVRMARQKVIVKRLAAIQDLGSMDTLCTDKTGTLTEARITLQRHVDPDGRDSDQVLELAYLNSFFETGLRSPLDEALLEHTEVSTGQWRKIDEVPFDFDRRRVSVLLDDGERRRIVVKGAPEDILGLSSHCPGRQDEPEKVLDANTRTRLDRLYAELSEEGFRSLGVAYRDVDRSQTHARVTDESELIFAGFAAFLDPARPEAGDALASLAARGVTVKIVTGDDERVTQHLCRQLGIVVTGALTGQDIARLDDHGLGAAVERANLFCRVNPGQKCRIIRALKQRGKVVGYLGDGINDAPALHEADVSLSVDTAVDVAKEAADMILLEHDLRVLYQGVLEGRRTFGNIMKYIMMGTSSNFGNMFSMAGASLWLPFLPMMPTQILLNNFIYDVSEVPIPLDHVDEDYLDRPRRWDMRYIRNFMLTLGPVSSLFDFLTFSLMLTVFQADPSLFQTGWFMESLATQVLVIFIIRTRHNPLRSRPNVWLWVTSLGAVALATLIPFTPLGHAFGFTRPPITFVLALLAIVCVYLLVVEAIKRWFFRHFEAQG